MADTTMLGTGGRRLALAVALATAAEPSLAAEFNLRAAATTVTMPDGAVIPMWGFACDSAVPPAVCPNPGVVTVPGPALTVAEGDTTLVVNLTNDLPVPVSIVVPGQAATAMIPVWTDGTSGPRTSPGQRVRSFTHEAPPGGGPVQYVWSGLRPGTFLYESGTHPQVQVQMGLYGAVTKRAGAGLAYPGVPYGVEHLLVFSEIDPALHDAVAGPSPTYGTPAYPSTIGYQPRYFLVNGAPFTPTTPCLAGGTATGRVLLRMVNAGLRELAPAILQAHWDVVAEGGAPYRVTTAGVSAPHAKRQFSALLPPGGTVDVVLTPAAAGDYGIIDRRLNLTNAAAPDGGFQGCIRVAALAGQPVAQVNGPYSGAVGAPISFSGAGSDPGGGTIAAYAWSFGDGTGGSGANPSHAYAAPGTYAVSLTVTDDGGLTSAPATTTATVVRANLAPVADAGGPYAAKVGFPVSLDGAGSSDPDGDALTYAWSFGDGESGAGVAPVHTYAAAGDAAVALVVSDGLAGSAPAGTTAHVTVNAAPVASAGGPYLPPGLAVTFDGSASRDPDNENADPLDDDLLAYSWNFGDGTTGTGPAPAHEYLVPGTYTVTLWVHDGYEFSPPATTTATITAAPATNKHVGDLDGAGGVVSASLWRAVVTVTVHDAAHAPLAGAIVNGSFSAGGRVRPCTTNASGQCNLTSNSLSRTIDRNVLFTVNSLTGAGATYYQPANHDPDAAPQSSNGTSITVLRP